MDESFTVYIADIDAIVHGKSDAHFEEHGGSYPGNKPVFGFTNGCDLIFCDGNLQHCQYFTHDKNNSKLVLTLSDELNTLKIIKDEQRIPYSFNFDDNEKLSSCVMIGVGKEL